MAKINEASIILCEEFIAIDYVWEDNGRFFSEEDWVCLARTIFFLIRY
jgi:hypothetical protein